MLPMWMGNKGSMKVYAIIHDDGCGHEHLWYVCSTRKRAEEERRKLYALDCEWTTLNIVRMPLIGAPKAPK